MLRNRQLIACALLLLAATGLLMFLNYSKFASTFENRTRDRHGIIIDNLSEVLQAQLALGLAIRDTTALRELLERSKAHDASIRALAVIDTRGIASVVVGQGSTPLWQTAIRRPTRDDKPAYVRQDDIAVVAMPLRDAFNLGAGWLVLEYPLRETREQTHQAFASIWPAGLLGLAVALGLMALVGPRLIAPSASSSPAGVGPDTVTRDASGEGRRLTVLVSVLLLMVQCVFAWTTYQAFSRVANDNAPLLAATLAQTLQPGLERALDLDIAVQDLRGVQEWLRSSLSAAPEFKAAAVNDPQGNELFQASATAGAPASLIDYGFPLKGHGVDAGRLKVSLDLQVLAERKRQLAIEFLTLLLVGALLSYEVLRAINVSLSVSQQGGNLGHLGSLRLPLFLFFLSSELPRTFLPIWSGELASSPLPATLQGSFLDAWSATLAGIPSTVLASVPIAAFLLAGVLASPYAGNFSARWGPRRLLLAGTALAFGANMIGLFTESLLMLFIARFVAGVSFAFASVAAFDIIGRQGGSRAAGMALYLTAYVAAGICGAGLGALVVDRAGIPVVFVLGLIATLLSALTLRGVAPVAANPGYVRQPLLRAIGILFSRNRFARLIMLITLPMQIVQQGLLFYWVPLALSAQGEHPSFIGLTMMGYFLMVLLLNGPLAGIADRTGRHARIIAGGLAIAGIAIMLNGLVYDPVVIAAANLLIGVAWALGFPSQGAMALRISQTELAGVDPAVTIGVYRAIERLGAMLAPVLVAVLIVGLGYAHSALLMGAVMLICALSYGWISRRNP